MNMVLMIIMLVVCNSHGDYDGSSDGDENCNLIQSDFAGGDGGDGGDATAPEN